MFRLGRLLAAVICGGLLVGLPAFFWISERPKVLRALYPITGALAAHTLRCSADSPAWLVEASKYALWRNSSPAGQLVHISPQASVQTCHYGWSGTPLRSERVTGDTRFRYASLTKLLTADMMLRDIATGNVTLDSDLLGLLGMKGELADERLKKITINQLLRHSSGIDRLRSVDTMVIHNKKPWCPYDLAPLADLRLDFDPGTEYAYHNLNYCLLGVLLEKTDPYGEDFRALLERKYDLAARGMRFIDGPYLQDEVNYDFRHSNFYGRNYWKYFDFHALSSSMGLSGNAQALAELLASLGDGKNHPLIQAPVESICNESVKRGCYGYALFRYRPAGQELVVHVQPGLLYGAPSLAIIDEHGGITVWVGNGTRYGGGTTDAMLDHLYAALAEHYAASPQ